MPERQTTPGEVSTEAEGMASGSAPGGSPQPTPTNGHVAAAPDTYAAGPAPDERSTSSTAPEAAAQPSSTPSATEPDARGAGDSGVRTGGSIPGAEPTIEVPDGQVPDVPTPRVQPTPVQVPDVQVPGVEAPPSAPATDPRELTAQGPTTLPPAGASPTVAPVQHPAEPGPGVTPTDPHGAATTEPPPADAERTVVLAPGAGGNSWFEPWADDPTQAIPLAAVRAPVLDPAAEQPTRPSVLPDGLSQTPISQEIASADPVTERLPVGADGSTVETHAGGTPKGATGPADGPPPAELGRSGPDAQLPRRRGRTLALIGAGVLVLLGLLYGGDLLLGQGSVPRGVSVAGVPLGGLSLADAEQRLRATVEPRTSQPVDVRVGQATSTVDPAASGLAVDWRATIATAGAQPLNPVTRLTSFFTTSEVDVVTTADEPKLEAALAELSPIVDRPPVEGTVRFDGTTPVAVEPQPGSNLDVAAAAAAVRRDWVTGGAVELPLTSVPSVTTRDDVAKAIATVAQPAVSAPFTVAGEGGTSAVLTPQTIATVLTFRPGRPGDGLIGEVNPAALETAIRPALAASEKPGRDATIDISAGGAPVVVPSQDGRGVDYAATAVAMGPPLIGAGPRQAAAVYADQPAELTTEKLNQLGITGLVSEFTTRGFAADSGQNIKRAAEQLDGTIVQPGETFSLNAATNPRDAAHGYVEAGIIEDGHPSRGVGGGVSQVATTLYNASYFAGMTNVEHKEHSFYISRYPAGREATVFDDIIDVKFRNDGPTGVMIQTVWTPSSVTVRFFGTKYYEVSSTTGPRTDPTDPKTVTIPDGQPCSASTGAPGFTVTDTRTLRDLRTGQVRSDPTRTVKYNPSPIVECGG